MLPLFGNVRAWMMTPADIIQDRPGPPRSTASALIAAEVAEVRRAVGRGTRKGACDRELLGRWSEHAHASRTLEFHCGVLHPQSRVQ
jgi:hypothetical protein